MEEIIPHIESSWRTYFDQQKAETKLLLIENTNRKELCTTIMKSNKLIITCFNAEIAKAIYIVKKELQLDIQIVFYLHGLSTIGCWPFYLFKIEDAFNEHDLFIANCDRDVKTFNFFFPHLNCQKIRFNNSTNSSQIQTDSHQEVNLVYGGRLSWQKNILELIEAYLACQHPRLGQLFLYGDFDDLKMPNYNTSLPSLKKKLKAYLSHPNIKFMGQVTREELFDKLPVNPIGVFASTHSDENFGMVIHSFLRKKIPIISTDWGAHCDYPKYTNAIFLSEVLLKKGQYPKVCRESLSKNIYQLVKDYDQIQKNMYYNETSITSQIEQALKSDSPTLNKDLKKGRSLYESWENSERNFIFSSFHDQLAIKVHELYSGKKYE